MKRFSLPALAALLVLGLGGEAQSEEAARKPGEPTITNPTLKKHLLENIDVFGKSDMPAIYILGPGVEDIEGAILVRDFSRDPFFMQNIDREEFELKVTLRDLSDMLSEDKDKIQESAAK
jgi:hypothetical protein